MLGAIIAGGKSTRFGTDKAYARHHGKRLIDLVGSALAAQCDALAVCGREEDGFECLPDRPEPDMGPLGGLNAALYFAQSNGFDAVLSAGCDIPNLPDDLAASLAGQGPAIVRTQPVVGMWPVSVADDLNVFLEEGGRALYAFAERVDARQIELATPLMNVNRPEDLQN